MQNTETKWCAVYTRKSTDEGLDSAFNSLDAHNGEKTENRKFHLLWLILKARNAKI